MNLKELNSFKLSDAVTFHDKLNPKLWNGTKLRPEVREQLLKIAEDFLTELGVHDLDVKDITISGSNAAYSYTKYSDLDLHILVDMGNLPVDEVYRELFTAKKTIYNDTHDITIHKIPVELYVQDSRQPVVSLGEYSVMNDQWIKIPTKRRSDFDQTATKSKYEKLLSLIEIALQSKKYSKVKHIIDTIKRYRQAGLDKGGEFGPENLAYKMLRSQGYITKLYELRDKLHSEKLSFETMYQNIDEEINPDIFNLGFEHEQEIGDYLYTAHVQIGRGTTNYLLIGCYDGDALVGKAHFEIRPKQGWLESANTEVNKKYQKKGIASTMYAYAKMLGNDITPSPHQSNMGKKMWAAWDKSGDAQYLMKEDPEETNHWYDAGVKDAQRDAKLYPDRVVKKLNPRTRLKTMQDKRARHPEEVEQYSLGYRGVTQDVDENTAAGINKMFNNLGDPVFANLQRVALLAMQGRQQEAAGRLQTVIKDANPAVQKKITDAVNNIKPVTINGRVADSSTLDKSKQHNDWIINTFIPWVQSLLGQQGVAEGEINDTAISLSKLGKFHPGPDALAEFVPERASAQYALHPDKWESTFYSLTNKDSDKLRYYGPKKISIPPGTLVGDMAIANKFYRAKTSEEKQQYAEAYKASLQSYPVDVNQYRMPELLMPRQNIDEAFDTPLPITWEKGMHGDIDALAKLPDGSNLSIMFNKQDNIKPDDKTWMIEFYRNNSQEVSGDGDAQKVFATVLTAIQQFITKYKPLKIYFSASKDNWAKQQQNSESRAKLYDRMVLRYAKSWGYKFFRADNGSSVMYQLSRIPKQKAVGEDYTMQFAAEKTPPVSPYAGVKDNQYRGGISEAADKKISFKVQKGKGKFSTTLTVNNSPAGIYQYDSNTGRSIAEVYPEFKGKGLGKLLVLHAIYTAAQLGLDFQEDESRTAAYDNVLDSLSSNGYIVDDDGYWYVTGEGEQYLKQSLNEASGYIPSEKQKNDPRFKTALTVDVHPDSIKKNAKAFYWNTSRAGIPPTAKTNGKIY